MKAFKAMPVLAMGTLAFGLVGATVLAPVANAVPKPGPNQNSGNNVVTQVVKTKVVSHLGIELPGGGSTLPETDGTQDTDIKIKSNAEKGATLTLSDDDEDTNLVNENDANAVISTTADASSSKGWGAVIDGAQKAMPKLSATALVVAKSAAPGDITGKVKYAIKTDNTLKPGTYKDVVRFTLTANL